MKRLLSVLLSVIIACGCLGSLAVTDVDAASYNPSAAVSYASRYWKNYNPAYNNYNSVGGDCANFVSQCLYAGGIQQDSTWYNGSYAWINCAGQIQYFDDMGYKVIDNAKASDIKVGNPVYYYNGNKMAHAAICVGFASDGTPLVAAHNNDHWEYEWTLGGPNWWGGSSKRVTILMPEEPEIKYWYEDLELVDLGNNFSARIRNVDLDVLVTNFNGNVVIGKHYDYKIARQIWNFDRNSDGSYKIKSCLNDYCMELHNFDDFDGGNITCIPDNGSTAQDWFIYLNSDGSYSMRPKCSDERAIDVSNGNPTDGNNLQLWSYNKSYSQKFSIEKCGEVVNLGDVFAASIEHTDYWKPIYQDDTDNVVLTTSSKEKMSGILWYFDRDEENGWYTITSYKNAKCLEVEDNSTEQGANVQCGDYVGTHGQHWFILRTFDSEGIEYYYIKSACSSNNLDLDNNSAYDGTNIKMWSLNGSDAQRYSIYKVEGDTSYSISANKTMKLGECVDIIIDDTTFVTSYKFHIVYPDGKEKVIDNKCNNVYKFTPDKEGKYIVYGEVESPVSKYIGSESDKSIVIMVEEESTVEITSVSIYSAPTKTNYYVGSPFASAGLKLLVKYSDGSTEILNTGYSTSGFDSTSVGTKTITVYYKGFSDAFKITVNEKPVVTEPTDIESEPIIETEPTDEATQATVASDPTEMTTAFVTETTEPVTKDTKPTETIVTEPSESKPVETTVTEPAESEVTSTVATVATDNTTEPTESYAIDNDKPTDPTEPSTPDETKPTDTTTPDETKPTEPAEDKGILGDVNGDGKVNIKDATQIQKFAAKLVELTEAESLRADINGDSKVNVKDATVIQKYVAKFETGYLVGEPLVLKKNS